MSSARFSVMDFGTIKSLIAETRPKLEAAGVTHLAVFGSRATDRHSSNSDLDVLIDVDKKMKFSIIDLVGVERILSETLGIKTQAVMRRSLSTTFKSKIAQDVRDIF